MAGIAQHKLFESEEQAENGGGGSSYQRIGPGPPGAAARRPPRAARRVRPERTEAAPTKKPAFALDLGHGGELPPAWADADGGGRRTSRSFCWKPPPPPPPSPECRATRRVSNHVYGPNDGPNFRAFRAFRMGSKSGPYTGMDLNFGLFTACLNVQKSQPILETYIGSSAVFFFLVTDRMQNPASLLRISRRYLQIGPVAITYQILSINRLKHIFFYRNMIMRYLVVKIKLQQTQRCYRIAD